MMGVIRRLWSWALPEAPPPPPSSKSPKLREPRAQAWAEDAGITAPQSEMHALERRVYEEVRKNKRAALASLAVGHKAISAEERSRQVLDELMRSMDRGNGGA